MSDVLTEEIMMGGYFDLPTAAYLMGISVEGLDQLCESNQVHFRKPSKEGGPKYIHASELAKFKHPWEHIFRLDQRINAQQALVEILKGKINMNLHERLQVEVNDLRQVVQALRNAIDDIATHFYPMQRDWPPMKQKMAEVLDRSEEKPKRRPSRKERKKR